MGRQVDLEEEQRFLARAYEALEITRRHAEETLREAYSAGRGTPQSVTERDVAVRTSLARIEQLRLGHEALVFGRIDLAPTDTAPEGETFRIGRLAVADPEDQESLVIDWRAPIAEPFYRATGRHTMGLRRRRHFMTSGPRIVGLEDELFGEGEGDDVLGVGGHTVLLAALERSRTGRMSDIVATVQKEQDEIIRAPLSGIVLVQGGPGTGKTAVALHRAAYLLYTHRFPLDTQGVLVVGPNPLFLHYIELVLPSLGESGVELSTIGGLSGVKATGEDTPEVAKVKGDARMAKVIDRAIRTRQRPLSKTARIAVGAVNLTVSPEDSEEAVQAARRRHGTHNARRKVVEGIIVRKLLEQYEASSSRLREAVARPTRERNERPGGGRRPAWKEQQGRATISELPFLSPSGGFEDDSVGDGPGPRQESGREKGPSEAELAKLAAAEPDEWASISELPSARRTDEDVRRELRKRPAVQAVLDRIWPVLTPEELLHDLFGAQPLIDLAAGRRLKEAERRLLFRARSATPAEVAWTPSDLALLDEARSLLGSSGHRRRVVNPAVHSDEDLIAFGHVVVDEAQDLTPMQLRMLSRRSISGSMTVVGDLAQATGPLAPRSWQDQLAHLPTRRGVTKVELTVNYRTPSEIMRLAARVLAAAAPWLTAPESVRSSGDEPVFVQAGSGHLAAAVAQTVATEHRALESGTMAVLAPPSLVDAVGEALGAAGIEAHVASDRAADLDAPVTVIPAGMAKGLEFDGVVLVEPQRVVDEADEGLRSLFVALTRATRRLAVVHEGNLPASMRPPVDSPPDSPVADPNHADA